MARSICISAFNRTSVRAQMLCTLIWASFDEEKIYDLIKTIARRETHCVYHVWILCVIRLDSKLTHVQRAFSFQNPFRQISRHSHQKQLNFMRRFRSIDLGFLACFVVCLFVFWFCSAEAVRWYFRCFQFFNSTNWLRFAKSQHILIGYLIQNRWRNIMSTHYGHWLSSLMPLVLPHQFSRYYCCICQLNTSNNKSEIETIWNIQKYSTWCQYNRLFG